MNSIVTKLADARRLTQNQRVDVSVVVPIYDEEENIPLIAEKLFSAMEKTPYSFEVIAVNDGSKDGSFGALEKEAARRKSFRVLNLRRNSGQTAAMMAGVDHSSGDVIVTIDADLQNDPDDIGMLLEKLHEGYDVVSGWRKDRKDARIKRTFVSNVANSLISQISGVRLQDYGCSLKAYRRDVIQGVRLYGEMHRFIPIYASWFGARVVEVPVRHHARQFGKSKYGLNRMFKVVLDLIVVKFLDRYLVKPIYVFGGFGLFSLASSFLVLVWAIGLKLLANTSLIQTPLPLLAALLALIGVNSILLGLVAEIQMRTYFESQDRVPYLIRDRLNFAEQA